MNEHSSRFAKKKKKKNSASKQECKDFTYWLRKPLISFFGSTGIRTIN